MSAFNIAGRVSLRPSQATRKREQSVADRAWEAEQDAKDAAHERAAWAAKARKDHATFRHELRHTGRSDAEIERLWDAGEAAEGALKDSAVRS